MEGGGGGEIRLEGGVVRWGTGGVKRLEVGGSAEGKGLGQRGGVGGGVREEDWEGGRRGKV